MPIHCKTAIGTAQIESQSAEFQCVPLPKCRAASTSNVRFGAGFFCGCRPGCKKFLTVQESDRVRSSVRPQCAAFSEAAGRYGDQRIGSKSRTRALCLYETYWFSQPRSVRSFRPFRSSSSHPKVSGFSLRLLSILRQPRSAPDLDNLLLSSERPKWSVPSCSPVLLQRASLACALTFDPTRSRPG